MCLWKTEIEPQQTCISKALDVLRGKLAFLAMPTACVEPITNTLSLIQSMVGPAAHGNQSIQESSK